MAKAVTKTKASPKKEEANLPATQAKTSLPTVSEDFAGLMAGGTGLENVTAADLLIPRLTILQSLSPQLQRSKTEYDAEAKVGEIYDVGLQERFPDGLHFLPVHYAKQWLEWAPRASNKGLIAIHDNAGILDKCEQDEKRRWVLPNGNYIMETAQFYGLNLTAGGRKSFIPMTSTQLKKARRLLTLATSEKITLAGGREITPPIFYRTYHFTTALESNAEGEWNGWKIERDVSMEELPNFRALMDDVKSFREALTNGSIAGDIAAMAEEAGQVIDGEADGEAM
jgi:hypothetical protein